MKETGGSIEKSVGVIGKDSLPAAYWYASNLGKWAKGKGFAVVLGKGYDRVGDAALRGDGPQGRLLPRRCLALLGHLLRRRAGFAGGDLTKSRALL